MMLLSRRALGLIGSSEYIAVLADELLPHVAFQLAAYAPVPQGAAAAAAAGTDAHIQMMQWPDMLATPAIDAIVLHGHGFEPAPIIAAALAVGKPILCASPLDFSPDAMQLFSAATARAGVLDYPGTLRYTPAGLYCRDVLKTGQLGELHSVFVSVRARWDSPGDMTGAWLWDVLDFLAMITEAPLQRVHAVKQAVPAAAHPHACVCLLTFADGLVATVDISLSLPPSYAATAGGEVEVELVGSRQVLRLEPSRTPLRVYGQRSASLRPWLAETIVTTLVEFAPLLDDPVQARDNLTRLQRVAMLHEAVSRAAAVGLGSWHRRAAGE